jgi:hypothetical protein
MPLISNITTFKKYLRVVFTSTTDNGLPNMVRADRKYLVPVLGQSVYNVLMGKVTANNHDWDTLLDICRSYVAPMAMLLELPSKQVQITDSGIKKTTSTDLENAFRWEYLELKNALEQQAAEALDELWQHLFESGSTYSWAATNIQGTIIKTATEFKKYYLPLQHSYRCFTALQPVMVTVQDQIIHDAITKDFFEYLRDVADPSAEEKIALELLKKAAAYLTIMAATEQLSVKISGNGFTVIMHDAADAPFRGDLNAPAENLSLVRAACEKTGQGYLQQLKKYLNETATATVMPIYFNSNKYTAPGTIVESANKKRNGVFSL